MMNETLQRGYAQDVMPNFEVLMKLTEDRKKRQVREREIVRNREILLRQAKRDAQRTRQIIQDQLSRRRARQTTVDNSCHALSLFNLRF